MKAAVYYRNGGPEVFQYEEVPDPVCRPGEVLVDVRAVGVEGGDAGHRAHGGLASVPHIVGYNCAGVIREVGADVPYRSVGQRVTVLVPYGSYASLISVPAGQTWLVPDGVPIEQAACVPVAWGTAHDCLFEFGQLRLGQSVLIQGGASGVGLASVQLAKRAGATVFATAGSDEKIERLRDYGVHHGINYRATNFVREIRRLTEGRGVDLVVDPVGGDTLPGSLQCLAYRGRLVTIGNVSHGDMRIDAESLRPRNQALIGFSLAGEMVTNTNRVRSMIDNILRDIAAGELNVVVDRTFPLSATAEAHTYIESRAAFGRVVLVP